MLLESDADVKVCRVVAMLESNRGDGHLQLIFWRSVLQIF